VGASHLSEGQKAIDERDHPCVLLYLGNIVGRMLYQLVEYPLLDNREFFLRVKDLLFVFLQFFRNVSLRVNQGLLANPIGGDLVFVRVADFKVVPENLVVRYLQRRYTRARTFALLHLEQIILAGKCDLSQLVKFIVHSDGDGPPMDALYRVVVLEGSIKMFPQILAWLVLVSGLLHFS